jgi:hypothetical protein
MPFLLHLCGAVFCAALAPLRCARAAAFYFWDATKAGYETDRWDGPRPTRALGARAAANRPAPGYCPCTRRRAAAAAVSGQGAAWPCSTWPGRAQQRVPAPAAPSRPAASVSVCGRRGRETAGRVRQRPEAPRIRVQWAGGRATGRPCPVAEHRPIRPPALGARSAPEGGKEEVRGWAGGLRRCFTFLSTAGPVPRPGAFARGLRHVRCLELRD